ncbi:MAG: acyl-CoA synthetase [Nitrospira sp.]|nr:acyl-CoA synthetase [Nitrospira sp.]
MTRDALIGVDRAGRTPDRDVRGSRCDPAGAAATGTRPFAWRHGHVIDTATFAAQAAALAARLPEGQPVNLCSDRYRFALGFVAALLRGQTSLLPPNAMPQTLRRLAQPGATLYALVDDPAQDTAQLAKTLVADHDPASTATPPLPTDGHWLAGRLDGDLWAACLLTSGSTGVPQPQHKRWRALQLNAASEAAALAEQLGWPSIAGLNIVATVPPQHSYGFESSVLLALLCGAAFDAGRPFYPADIADALARLPPPRALVTTPVHLKTLLAAGVELPPTDLVLSATAPLSPQLAQAAEARLGGRTLEIYGCTEAGQVASRRTTAGEVWTTNGALRLHREATPDGERFVVQGGHVLEPTALADVLELLDERHFKLLGRANDLIHVAGKRSSLAHLNFHLNHIDGVDDGVFWLPDEVAGEVVRPIAFVVAPRLGARQIIDALRRELEGAFVPRRVVHVNALPREATGKITAQVLRKFALRTLAGPATPAPLEVEQFIDATLPAFDGHFPGAPVLPGAHLLALVQQAIAGHAAWAQRVGPRPLLLQLKLLAAVGPGQRLRIRLEAPGPGIAFSVQRGSTVVARGQFAAADAGSP